MDLALELQEYILNHPSLGEIHGILRGVCRTWRDILDKKRKICFRQICTISLYKYYLPDIETESCYVLCYAITRRDLLMTKWMIQKKKIKCVNCNFLNHAVKSGSLKMVKYIKKKSNYISNLDIIHAIILGHLNILKYLVGRCDYSNDSIIYTAASYGKINVLEWVKSDQGETFDFIKCLEAAIDWDMINVVEWILRQNHTQEFFNRTMKIAVTRGNLSVLKWGYENSDFTFEKDILHIWANDLEHFDITMWFEKL